MQHVPGPDFPTAGIINGAREIYNAYTTGRGRIVRARNARSRRSTKGGREAIIITELPVPGEQGAAARAHRRPRARKLIEGISELRDESDKDGMRVVIELKRGENADIVLNNLYKQTPMESVFGINMVALRRRPAAAADAQGHARGVPAAPPRGRHAAHDVRPAQGPRARPHPRRPGGRAREHRRGHRADQGVADAGRGEGRRWARALAGGAVPEMLERAGAVSTRPEGLASELGLHDGRATGCPNAGPGHPRLAPAPAHRARAGQDPRRVRRAARPHRDLCDILARPSACCRSSATSCSPIRDQYGDARRTEIERDQSDLTIEDLIDAAGRGRHAVARRLRQVAAGQRVPGAGRGGRGASATAIKDEDFIDKLFVANTHDTLLCFSSRGKVYWLKVYELPQAGRGSRGKPIVNLLPLEDGERINAVLPIREYTEDKLRVHGDGQGTVKKTPLSAFSRPRTSGIIAVGLDDGDKLVGVDITDGKRDVMLFTTGGKAIRFPETTCARWAATPAACAASSWPTARRSVIAAHRGPRGPDPDASENGYGKLTRSRSSRCTGAAARASSPCRPPSATAAGGRHAGATGTNSC
jgi:DNA gyrase subunit A